MVAIKPWVAEECYLEHLSDMVATSTRLLTLHLAAPSFVIEASWVVVVEAVGIEVATDKLMEQEPSEVTWVVACSWWEHWPCTGFGQASG